MTQREQDSSEIALNGLSRREIADLLSDINEEQFRKLLAEINNSISYTTDTRKFETVSQQIATCTNPVIQKIVSEYLNSSVSDDLRILCASIRASYFRRLRQFHKSRECLEANTTPSERQTAPVLNHLLAITYVSGDPNDAHKGLIIAREVLRHSSMSNNPGALHSAAHLSLIAALDDRETQEECELNLNQAEEYCRKAIELESNRARYYYTLARIQRAKRRYSQARRNIQHAIEIEERDTADAMLRITDYMIEESRIESDILRHQALARLKEIQDQHDSMHHKMDLLVKQIPEELAQQSKENDKRIKDAEKMTIGLLGFFAGILSLLQISSQKISQVDSAGEVFAQIGSFALIIGVFVLGGAYLINRTRRTR